MAERGGIGQSGFLKCWVMGSNLEEAGGRSCRAWLTRVKIGTTGLTQVLGKIQWPAEHCVQGRLVLHFVVWKGSQQCGLWCLGYTELCPFPTLGSLCWHALCLLSKVFSNHGNITLPGCFFLLSLYFILFYLTSYFHYLLEVDGNIPRHFWKSTYAKRCIQSVDSSSTSDKMVLL